MVPLVLWIKGMLRWLQKNTDSLTDPPFIHSFFRIHTRISFKGKKKKEPWINMPGGSKTLDTPFQEKMQKGSFNSDSGRQC